MATTTTSTLPTAGSTTSYVQPQYYTDTATQMAGGVQDLLGTNGYMNNVMSNWYNTAPGQGALGQFSQFDPNQQQQFMNPYVSNVVDANTEQSNRNLFETVLPQVNSTFTGAGQFGSSRNADFTNRAVRDQQQNLMNTNATTLMGAQGQAATQYQNWQNMGNTAAQNDYQNWLTRANYPLSGLSQVGQMLGNLKPPQVAGVSTTGPDTTNLDKISAVLATLNTGLNDNTINSILEWIGAGDAVN